MERNKDQQNIITFQGYCWVGGCLGKRHYNLCSKRSQETLGAKKEGLEIT